MAKKDSKMTDEKIDAVKMVDAPMETKGKTKGKLICRFEIRGMGDNFKAGDEYTGENTKRLLEKKAIYRA